jgi:hypothetical protein
MALWPEDYDVQFFGLVALGQLLSPEFGAWPGAGAEGEAARRPELIVNAMRAFPREVDLRKSACRVIEMLEDSGLVEAGQMGQAGAWEAVARAMARVRDHRTLQGLCCMAVTAMAKRSPVTEVVPHGVGEAVAAALAAFPRDAAVQESCQEAEVALNGGPVDRAWSLLWPW